MPVFVLVTSRGTVLARSPSRDYLKLRQKRESRRTRIIELTPAQQRMAHARKIKEEKFRARKQKAWWARAAKARQAGRKLKSSFVDYLEYDSDTNNVHVTLSGRKYTFMNVPPSIFNAWRKGAATCTTDDTGKKKRWWIGKTPSLGAFFNTYIKPKYSFVHGWV